jgi:hypothetical protein
MEQIGAKPTDIMAAADEVVVTDKHGRALRLRRETLPRRRQLYKLAGPENSRNAPLFAEYRMALSVIAIDDKEIVFPAKLSFLEATMDRLGDDGLEAVAKAWTDNKWIDAEQGKPDEIKN